MRSRHVSCIENPIGVCETRLWSRQPSLSRQLCSCRAPAPSVVFLSHLRQQAFRSTPDAQLCSLCISRAAQHAQQPAASHAYLRHSFAAHSRQYHASLNSPATTAADAPSLANLQGLLHVYKQSLDHLGRDAVEQLRHTLAPSDEEDLHEEDTGKH